MTQSLEPDEAFDCVVSVPLDDSESIRLLQEHFAGEDVSHSRGFTGLQTFTVVLKCTTSTLRALLAWFTKHGTRFEAASIQIDKERVLIKGYPIDDVNDLLASKAVHSLLRDLKRK